MQMADTDLDTITAVIAHSQIVVAQAVVATSVGRISCLPAAYDDADLAILDWLIAESRYAGRRYVRM
jgi:hypothetical protein